MCDCFVFLGLIKRCENDRQNPLLTVNDIGYAPTADELHTPTAAMTLLLTSWLNGHWFRYLILLMCSPLLIPLVFAISPFICVAEVCFYLFRRSRRCCRLKSGGSSQPPPVPRHQEDVEGGGQVKPKVSLLDRYLDDQLELAVEILRECGGDLGYRYDYIDDFDGDRSNRLC